MTATVRPGAHWGDAGKGKASAIPCDRANQIVGYQGGNNAGNTAVIGDQKYALYILLSGLLSPNAITVMGNGDVIDKRFVVKKIKF
jgi:adenylosuccinate synthase